eukprot:CAMPEP_0194293604 /NCGR_PEP_ID=MMETSP0169-20130528/48298_1 /TAXON_ID=218684 /ORGANISM="Corethron pennatum, Strain L29A3" /LENGTH=301 /DNA_ID=CAMNT_0039042171 /DNA_START=57 /DNA_END=959 /DNA_ORIENTATION=-
MSETNEMVSLRVDFKDLENSLKKELEDEIKKMVEVRKQYETMMQNSLEGLRHRGIDHAADASSNSCVKIITNDQDEEAGEIHVADDTSATTAPKETPSQRRCIGNFSPMTKANTGTISMYAVAVAVDSDARSSRKWANAVWVLAFVCFQCYVLFRIMMNAEKSVCTKGTTIDDWSVIFFLSMLWAYPITQDVEEAIIEERVLDHHQAGSLNRPAEVVRLALRVKRCVLPFVTSVATAGMILTTESDVKNLVLNFLAMTFISAADNVFGILSLRNHSTELMDKVVNNFNIGLSDDTAAVFFW